MSRRKPTRTPPRPSASAAASRESPPPRTKHSKRLRRQLFLFKLGGAVALQTILEAKDLPTYASLASYVFFTATGEEFDPAAIDLKTNFIGGSKAYDVYLIYTPDIEALKDLALDLSTVRALPKVKGGKERKRLVFAPTRFMDDSLLHQHGIVFSQLPYEIYERVEKTGK